MTKTFRRSRPSQRAKGSSKSQESAREFERLLDLPWAESGLTIEDLLTLPPPRGKERRKHLLEIVPIPLEWWEPLLEAVGERREFSMLPVRQDAKQRQPARSGRAAASSAKKRARK